AKQPFVTFPDRPVGTRTGTYLVADARVEVSSLSKSQEKAIALLGNWPDSLRDSVKPTWQKNLIVLPDADFQVLMEHSLWTQVRNKIQERTEGANQAGSAEVFWTDVCIPRDAILYFPWGYNLSQENPVTQNQHELLLQVLEGLIQVGGQANVGRGWAQSWVSDRDFGAKATEKQVESTAIGV
ncbi:MAG: type III-B CRISPR module RAMP protein Cmr4, partial [Cyanobacteriota bacterium]|nr:type III-B CRISPR module RAMP protein Cmr4 [Cyanobacteriota bacterium]